MVSLADLNYRPGILVPGLGLRVAGLGVRI